MQKLGDPRGSPDRGNTNTITNFRAARCTPRKLRVARPSRLRHNWRSHPRLRVSHTLAKMGQPKQVLSPCCLG
jgi:hypothetical protein